MLPDTHKRDMSPSGFPAMVTLDSAYLEPAGNPLRVSFGVLVLVEVHLSSRTSTEYVLSPVQNTVHEAGR